MQKPSCFLTLVYFFDGKSRLHYYDQTVNNVKKMKEHQKTQKNIQKHTKEHKKKHQRTFK